MPISREQRELRRKYLGASDMPAVVGLDPWRTSADVWASKVFELRDNPPSEAARAGTILEPSIMAWAQDQLGREIERDVFRTRGVNCANHDGLISKGREGVEAKTSGIVTTHRDEMWGIEGTDEVPQHVYVQVQAQCYVSNLDLVWVAALIGGRGFVMYRVPRDESIIGKIIATGAEFWEKHVITKVAPESGPPSVDLLRQIMQKPGKTITMVQGVVDTWQTARAARLAAEKEESKHEAAVRLLLGDAAVAVCQHGTIRNTRVETDRLDVKGLRAEAPDIAAVYTKTTESYRLTYKPNAQAPGMEDKAWNR